MTATSLLLIGVTLVLLVVVSGVVRRLALQRGGGTIELTLQLKSSGHGRGWVNGVGRFSGDELQWFRVFSLSPRPRRRWLRCDLRVLRTREPSGAEHRALLDGALVLECRVAGRPLELAMSRSARTGFLAWVEARPPGTTRPA